MRYMIWNNKGGVGKTFSSFLLSTEYAQANPTSIVVAIDMCPQANLSEMLLGGNGTGEKNLETLYGKESTITWYIKSRYQGSRDSKTGSETEFFSRVSEYNSHLPSNLYLLPGDIDLDIGSEIIQYLGGGPQAASWKNSRLLLRDLIDSFEKRMQKDHQNIVYFIDCNPSFANYTQLAVAASDRMLVPCTADSASIRAIHNLFRLIYGVELDDTKKPSATDDFINFSHKANDARWTLPQVHLFLQNKSRSHENNPSKAYVAHIEKIKNIATKAKKSHPEKFTNAKTIVRNIKDGNTLASVINHNGYALNKIAASSYQIYGQKTQVNQDQIDALKKDISACVKLL